MKISTFTIVARDPETGQIGIAGGTNWFCYGRWVLHTEAGFGALATQAETNMWYAPEGLVDLKKGMSAEETLKDLLERDPDENGVYQLLIIDNKGNTACHTGKNNPEYAGHILKQNLAVAGNTLVSKDTLEEVIKSYENSKLPFPHKLIVTLQAGQKAGGDLRGMKSAAIKVVDGESTGKYWNDTSLDLRVDESSDPLKELERLYIIAEAYRHIGNAEEAGSTQESLESYKKALTLDPTNEEIRFWIAYCLSELDKKDEAMEIIGTLGENWKEYWKRLVKKSN